MIKVAAEMAQIEQQCPFLANNSCTPKFCQSGRMIQSNEPRIGENRSLLNVVEDALDFLRQLRREQVIKSDEALKLRTEEVLHEIRKNSIWTDIADDGECTPPSRVSKEGFAGGSWDQTTKELEYGLRCAWKHARKCIMRSEHQNLRQVPIQQCPRPYVGLTRPL
jgi:hypothetical protein